MLRLLSRRQMFDTRLDFKRLRNLAGELEHCARLVSPNVKHIPVRRFDQRRSRYDWSDVIYVRERTRLPAIAKNCHRLIQ